MKPEILVLTRIYTPALAALDQEYITHKAFAAADANAFIKQVAGNVRAVVTTGLAGVSREVMAALPKLEIVLCFGNPRGTVDLAYVKERGIVVARTPDEIATPVADVAVGLMLNIMRRFGEADRFVRAGRWPQGAFVMGRDLNGKTCGIIGLGKIGREVATRARAFRMRVCYQGPRRKADVDYAYFADAVSLARESDCLIVTCPSNAETRGLINQNVLDALGVEGFLVNVARGAIVDRAALIASLRDKRIAGAGLDVFWDEPRVPAELTALENVILTPHIGSSTQEVRKERQRKMFENLHAHFAGKPVPYPAG
jgi:hydroxypyruvate reductase